MSRDGWFALLVGVGVPMVLRLLDYLMPKGRHFRWVERFSEEDTGAVSPLEDD